MVLAAFDQLLSNPFDGLVTLVVFCVSLVAAGTVHEFSHALSAALMGDLTAKGEGRLSLNPAVHVDPFGAVMFLLAGFGWFKPTPVSPWRLRPGERTGMALTSLAGPLSNIMLAMVVAVPVAAGAFGTDAVGFTLFRGGPGDVAGYAAGSFIFWNLLLAAFNLIPISPLDGFKVAVGVLPAEASERFARLEPYGPRILMVLIMLDYLVPGVRILGSVIGPIVNALAILVLGTLLWL